MTRRHAALPLDHFSTPPKNENHETRTPIEPKTTQSPEDGGRRKMEDPRRTPSREDTSRETPINPRSNSNSKTNTKLHISTNQISHPENADEKIGIRRKVVAVAVVVGGTAR
eukprot:m.265938 g.265938  ORF g.265938 m.265938 type:complete len:112 (+) comp26762_c2_seq1:1056-1391(+)